MNEPLYTKTRKFALMIGNKTFKASNVWLMHLRDCHKITFQKILEEKKSNPINDANEWG